MTAWALVRRVTGVLVVGVTSLLAALTFCAAAAEGTPQPVADEVVELGDAMPLSYTDVYRLDSARPPQIQAVSQRASPLEISNPAADRGRVHRAFCGSSEGLVAPNTTSGGLRTVADEVGEVRSYPSYRKAQADLGTSPSSDIHHIVEQCQCSTARSGFSVSRVNSTDNLIRLPGDVHDRISAFYSSRPPGFSTTVRNTLNGMPFEQQYDFGLDVIRRAMGGSL